MMELLAVCYTITQNLHLKQKELSLLCDYAGLGAMARVPALSKISQ